MKVIFLGTPDFGICALREIAKRHELLACVCQPDKVGARGKVEFCAVKKFALENNVPLFQFEKISRDGVETLRALAPDIMVTAAYGQILSQEVIDIAPHGIINIHGSLLPLLRGASPIQSALLQGFTQTGVTILQTVKAVDAGDMIVKKSLEIQPYENCGQLFDRLSVLGAEAVVEALEQIQNGTATYTPQDESQATFTKKISAEQEKIDWHKPASEIINLVRALAPNVGAHTLWNGQILKIFDLRLAGECNGAAGEVIESGKKTLVVACGDGMSVSVRTLQLQGAKRMDVVSFLCGKKIAVGTVLGE